MNKSVLHSLYRGINYIHLGITNSLLENHSVWGSRWVEGTIWRSKELHVNCPRMQPKTKMKAHASSLFFCYPLVCLLFYFPSRGPIQPNNFFYLFQRTMALPFLIPLITVICYRICLNKDLVFSPFPWFCTTHLQAETRTLLCLETASTWLKPSQQINTK